MESLPEIVLLTVQMCLVCQELDVVVCVPSILPSVCVTVQPTNNRGKLLYIAVMGVCGCGHMVYCWSHGPCLITWSIVEHMVYCWSRSSVSTDWAVFWSHDHRLKYCIRMWQDANIGLSRWVSYIKHLIYNLTNVLVRHIWSLHCQLSC